MTHEGKNLKKDILSLMTQRLYKLLGVKKMHHFLYAFKNIILLILWFWYNARKILLCKWMHFYRATVL